MSQFEDVLKPNSDELMFSKKQMCSNSLNETELNTKSTDSFLSECSLSRFEIEENKDVEGCVNLVIREIGLLKQGRKKELILDRCNQKADEDGDAEVSVCHFKEQEAHVCFEVSLTPKMEPKLENKRKQGENSYLSMGAQDFSFTMKDLTFLTWEEMIKDLQQEKETLLSQLRLQEQLVKDVQEQKTASDSVTWEVQSLFGRQLAVLQSQRDQTQAQADLQKERNKALSELLSQKSVFEKFLLKEQEHFKSEINTKEQSLLTLLKEKSTLEEKLLVAQQSLTEAENALEESFKKIRALEQTIDECHVKIMSNQKSNESERLELEEKLNASILELQKLSAEIAVKEKDYIQKENELTKEVACLKKLQLELEIHLEETLHKSLQNREEIQSEMGRRHLEEISKMKSCHQSELTELKLQLQKAVDEQNAEIRERIVKQQQLEAEQKEQIGIIKKVHEREHDREIAELNVQHENEMRELQTKLMKEQEQVLFELQQQMEASHQDEMRQAEALHNLKLEALRLNSNSIHTSQLELTQTNLRKEKETALVELREMLLDKHAQEVAVLQNRCQLELENIKDQNRKEKEEMTWKQQHELDQERKEMEEKHAQILESLKKEWALNTEISLKNLSEEMSQKHQDELNEMKRNLKAEAEEIKEKSLSLERERVETMYRILESQYQLTMTELQTACEQELQDVKEQSKKREDELQQEIKKLQTISEKLKADSDEEIKKLWSQLDNARASRQELSELKEQLLARTSHVEEIESLKKDFQSKWDKRKSDHESELEQLRLYFEQKLKAVEENYREELTMLHQRLQEKDYTLLDVEDSQDQHEELRPSITLLEEMTAKERHDVFEQLSQQLEQQKEVQSCLELHLNKKHRNELELLRSSLMFQYQEDLMKMKLELSDRCTTEIEELKRKHCLSLEQLRAKISEEHLREITKLRLQSAQDAARQTEKEVAERMLVLENEYKVKLEALHVERQAMSVQQEQMENTRRENTKLKEASVWQETHLKVLEQVKGKLIEDHASEIRRAREEIQEMELLHKTKAEEWKQVHKDLTIKAEEKLSRVQKELENKAESEKQALQKQFQLREAEMTCLQEQQSARIVELEKSLKEQQNIVQQLEDSLLTAQMTLAHYDKELNSIKSLRAQELENNKQELLAKLKNAQNRFVEESDAMTKNIMREHEIILQELREKHAADLELQSKEMQHKHEEQILSLTAELQTEHKAELETLRSTLGKKHAQLETLLAEMQRNHQAQMMELETKRVSDSDTLESAYLSEIQLLQEEHRQALEELQMGLREQLAQQDKANQMLLAQELDRMKQRHAEELQVCQDNLKIELATLHVDKLKSMVAELEDVHKEDLSTALEKERSLLEDGHRKALDALQEEVLHLKEKHKEAMQELQDLHVVELQKDKEHVQQLQNEMEQRNLDRTETRREIEDLNKEIEKVNAELKNLQQQRDRENEEGENLIALLRSDIELAMNDRNKLLERYQQSLKLLLKMVKAAKDVEDLICNKLGLCLEDSLASGDSGEIHSLIGEIALAQNVRTVDKRDTKRSERVDQVGKAFDQNLQECSFESSVPDEMSELSEHLCESIFEHPDLVFENDERICKICRRLHVAVEKLLEMLAESTQQLEETQKVHERFEEEFNRKNWETCQVVTDHHELMDCLNEESEAKNQLVLELHKARGLTEGYLAERAALETALHLKEESECRLVVELENLKVQFQELSQEHAKSVEDLKVLKDQNKVLTANVGESEVDLFKEIEHLAKAKLELQCQAEKDCSILNAQIKILEVELEEQLNKNQKISKMSLEIANLKEQIQALERQLKNQRDFMDKQAIEREHERDEFQEEIQKLEMQLKQAVKSPASGQSKIYEEDSLHNTTEERMHDYDQLFLDREQMLKELVVLNQDKEKLATRVQELECQNKEEARHVKQLSQELQKMKKMEAELKQDKEALQQQQYNNLIQISTLQSKLDEVRHRVVAEGSSDHELQEQLKAQEEPLTEKSGVASVLEELEQLKASLMTKNEEVLQLSSKLETENSNNVSQIIQLQEENRQLKEKIEQLSMQCRNPADSQLSIVPFLRSLLEEKNQETDHLNEQIARLENCKENKILENQMLEIEDLKSVIEHLRGDKERLLKDKTEEISQLHGVIEKLQKEIAFLEPVHHEISDSQESLNFVTEEQELSLQNTLNKGSSTSREEDGHCLLCPPEETKVQGQLDSVLVEREAWQQFPEQQGSGFKAEVKVLEQKLKNVQESSMQHLTELAALQLEYNEIQEEHKHLKMCLMHKDSDVAVATSCIRGLEDKLREREVQLAERDLQLQTLSELQAKQAAEIEHEKEKVTQLENELETLLKTLQDRDVSFQRERGYFQAAVVKLEDSVEKLETLRSERDRSQLKSSMENDENDQKEAELHQLMPEQAAFVPSEEIEEEGGKRKTSIESLKENSVDTSDKPEKDVAMSCLNTASQNVEIQDKTLCSMLLSQEAETINSAKEKENLNDHSQSTQLASKICEGFQSLIMNATSWDSPELMREQDHSMELQASLPLTPFSDVDGMQSPDLESLCSETSVIHGETSGLLGYSIYYSTGKEESAASFPFKLHMFSGPPFSVTNYDSVQGSISVRDAEDIILMPSEPQDDPKSTMSRLENGSTDHGRHTSSELALQLNLENSETTVHQDGNVMTYLLDFGLVPGATETVMKEKEMFSQQLKNVLRMVYEESQKILVLSEESLPLNDSKNIPQTPPAEGWQSEMFTLPDAVQSLKDFLSKVPQREGKEYSSTLFDWRGELLQAVQCVLERERNMLQNYLRSHFYSPGSGDEGSLIQKLEHIVEQQEQKQKIVLEHLLSSDRNGLLTEIQDLQAQLRLMHLQSQEKLQQLQETLINTENHGSKQEHQLRRQVELLEYKLEQERSIASDLQTSLKNEQDKATEMHELLKQEHTVILNLKSELCESKQTNERLQKSLQELQKEIIKYSSALENKEKGMTVILQDLETERLKEKELRNMLDEQQHQHKLREDEKSKAMEELQAALELQCIQNNQLSVALEHEQTANSNLRQELQIEHSRCEAFLSQEQSKVSELQKTVDAEKNHRLELLNALNHERLLTEQLSLRMNECGTCKCKESWQELQAQLHIERAHVKELAAILEKTRQPVLDSKRPTSEMKMCCEEHQKELDRHMDLEVTMEMLEDQKRDIINALEIQKQKEAQMRKEWEQLQSILRALKDQEKRAEKGAKEKRQLQQTELDQLKELQKAQENQLEFQHWQNMGRITELQQMLEDLKNQDTHCHSHRNQPRPPSCPSKNNDATKLAFPADAVMLHIERQKLENIRELLLFTAAYLSELVYKIVDRTVNRPAPNDEIITGVLHILEELKSELLIRSESPVSSSCIIKSMQETERIAWREDKNVLQNGLKTEYATTKTNLVIENKSAIGSSNLKLQKLYRKYLRAESFRKALVYQKKYLLLLLGGFQECEQATLSLIARMGIYPSPPDLNVANSRSRSFTKFRSAVRAVIAISRLKFLVKKWHKVSRKETPLEAISHGTGRNSCPRARIEVLRQREPSPLLSSEAFATQETGYRNKNHQQRVMNNCSSKSPHHLRERSTISSSQTSSKDPENSLTEYIAHLEAIQQRLGIIMPGQSPVKEKL